VERVEVEVAVERGGGATTVDPDKQIGTSNPYAMKKLEIMLSEESGKSLQQRHTCWSEE
jgi:hypothetical protein